MSRNRGKEGLFQLQQCLQVLASGGARRRCIKVPLSWPPSMLCKRTCTALGCALPPAVQDETTCIVKEHPTAENRYRASHQQYSYLASAFLSTPRVVVACFSLDNTISDPLQKLFFLRTNFLCFGQTLIRSVSNPIPRRQSPRIYIYLYPSLAKVNLPS